MTSTIINMIITVGLSAVGASFALMARDYIRESVRRTLETGWIAREEYRAAKYAGTYWAPPVTLRKVSDGTARPSWLYDGANRRMLRASEMGV